MNRYEVAVLFHPDLEIDLEKPLASIEKLIKDSGGKIENVNNWGKRKLAYPIKDQQFAVYVFYTVELPPAGPGELETKLNLADEVIRHLLVKEPEIQEQPEEETSSAPAEEKSSSKAATEAKKSAAKPKSTK